MRFSRQLCFYYIGGLALLILLAAIYWPGLTGGFFFDDSANIVESTAIQLNDISITSLMNLWEGGIAGPLGRPVSVLSFALNYYSSGFDPYWFKLTNLLIHCVNGVLVYVCSFLLMRATTFPNGGRFTKASALAVVVAVLWAFHPIQLTSVLYVVQRMTSLSSMFVLIALILHIWARQQPSLCWKGLICLSSAWGFFLPMAMLSKETGVLFVLYIAVYELVLHRRFVGRLDRLAKYYLALLALGCIGLLIYLVLVPEAGLLQGYATRNFSLSERILTESRIVWVYLKMIVAPALSDFGLYHDDFVVSTGLFSPIGAFFSICGLIGLLVSAWLLKEKAAIFSFGVLWFMAGHSLESTIFPLELMHEHRNYLPSLGIMALLGPILLSKQMSQPALKLLVSSAILAILLYFGLITYLRSDMYGDDFRRTQIEAEYRSESVRSHYEAGSVMANIYHRHRQPILATLAEKHFERVNALDPSYKLGLIGILQLACLSENVPRTKEYEELKGRLESGKWIPVDRIVMHGVAEMSNEGTLCFERKQVDDLFAAALRNKSMTIEDSSVVLSDYALYLWVGQKDYLSAREVLARAVAGNNNDVLNRINLLQLLRFLGDREGVLALLGDLKARELGRIDRATIQAIVNELDAEGVTSVGGV